MVNFLVGLNFVFFNCCIRWIKFFFVVDYKLLRIIFIYEGDICINIEDELLLVEIYFEF